MALSRRTILKGGVAYTSAMMPGLLWSQGVQIKTFFLLIKDFDPALAPSLVRQALASFFAQNIPVTAVAGDLAADGAATAVQSALGEIALAERGLFELVPAVRPVFERNRYFQLRSAGELRRRVSLLQTSQTTQVQEPTVVSFFDLSNESAIDPYAYRAAGFRIQIRPGNPDQPLAGTRVDPFDWGLLRVEGGLVFNVTHDPEQAMAKVLSMDGDQLVSITLDKASSLKPEDLLRRCAAWARQIEKAILDGEVFATRPMDYLLQGKPGASKLVGLLLEPQGQIGSDTGMQAFIESLSEGRFPFTLANRGGASENMQNFDTCVVLEDGTLTQLSDTATCVLTHRDTQMGDHAGAEIVILPPSAAEGWTGQREDGRFQIALKDTGNLSFARRLLVDPMTDRVEVVRSEQVQTSFQRQALLRQLQDARRDGLVHFHSVNGFMEQIVAPDPVLEKFWSTRRRQQSDPPQPRALGASEVDQYLEDARLAWRYIERLTNDKTGLCAGTAQGSSLQVANNGITLWDVASHIHGVVAASSLGIIEDSEAEGRLALLLDHLPVNEIDDAKLPPPLFRSNTATAVRPGFDSCDAGRFLIALRAAVNSGLVSSGLAGSALAKWDLASAVRDGRIFSYVSGKWVDATLLHCTPYIRRGFSFWGMSIASPYLPLGDNPSGDARIRMLHQTALLGHYGAEPSLLEAVELGHSPESRYLADVLFDSQLSWFESTGKFKCVSEVPLNFAPWFVFQGLRVDRRDEEAWVISARSTRAEYKTEAFRNRAEMISTKAAFLWAAAYPHLYSDSLVELARNRGRTIGGGFSSGIHASNFEQMRDYSDLNTNGIILTAIGRILGRLPKFD